MIGFLLGIVKNMMFLGYSLVESLVFMLAFNGLAPYVNDNLFTMPVTHLNYWMVFCLFIMVHFVGNFVKKLSPFTSSNSNYNTANVNEKE